MKHFIKNFLYGLFHALSTNGRDSRQAYCDIFRGTILFIVLTVILISWRTGPVYIFLQEWLMLSEPMCWVVSILWILWLFAAYCCAVMRRWQDLDIRIPKGESFSNLLTRYRFYEVLATEEGACEPNQYGPAPKENPPSLINEEDLKEAVRKKLFVDLFDAEKIK